MRLAVVFATLGRPATVASALATMSEQTREPDKIVISAVTAADAPPPDKCAQAVVVFGKKGLPAQRNTGLAAVGDSADVVVFFDDDFSAAPTYLERLEAIFSADPGIAGVTGHVIADGIGGPGYTFEDASRFLKASSAPPLSSARSHRVGSLYGCNMAIRLSHATNLAFDENLPLYAWQEDVDYSTQLGQRGKLVYSEALEGVHLGIKSARTPGRPLGYAQIANPIFLRQKRTMTRAHAYTLMARNLSANLFRSISPEPWCDRRGRLVGNLRAIAHLASGKLHPRNVLELI